MIKLHTCRSILYVSLLRQSLIFPEFKTVNCLMSILSAPRKFASYFKLVNLLQPKSRNNPVKSSQTVRNLKISKMSKSALVIIAQGAEEMETVITVDMLRRAGVSVTMAGLDGNSPVLCSRQVTLVPDKSLADALAEKPQYDAVILPGGLEGSDRLSKSDVVGTLLKEHEGSGKIIAAICAAPTAFVAHGVGKGKKITSYPTTKEKITSDYTYIEGEKVVIDGNFVTSRGPGTAYWFGLSLIELLTDKEKAAQVEKGMIITGY